MKRSHYLTVDRLEDRCVPSADPITSTVASPNQNSAPSASSTVSVPDPSAAAAAGSSSQTVVTVNSPGDQTNLVGDTVYLPVSAANSDGAPVVFSAAGLPNGLSIDPNTGIIAGTVGANAAQNIAVITATDAAGNGSASVTIHWTVKTPLLVVDSPGDQTNAFGDTVNVAVLAAATDGAALTFAAVGLPDGLSINPNSGIISGTVASDAVSGPVTITLTDPTTNVSANLTFNWTINQTGTPAPAQPAADAGYYFVIDIPINDPNALPVNPAPAQPTKNPGNPWGIYGWDTIPLVPPISNPSLF